MTYGITSIKLIILNYPNRFIQKRTFLFLRRRTFLFLCNSEAEGLTHSPSYDNLGVMKFIVKILINALAVAIAAYVIPNVVLDSFFTAVIVAVALGVINTFIKPIVNIFALPINLLTLGLFSIVINAAFILLVSRFIDGFEVGGFVTAIIFSLVLSLISSILGILGK